MRQKTIYTTAKYEVGDEVLLYGRQPEGGKETFYLSKKFAAEGYPGNLNSHIKCFHGWRGTSFGVSTYVYGVRRVEFVEATDREDEYCDTIYKVRVGKDLYPDKR